MYFILRGSVNVVKDGVILATLENGTHFGEMALAERKPTIRTASAICITPVSVGSLSITNFNIICESYPIFQSKIAEEVEMRKKDLINKTKALTASKVMTSVRKSHASINKKS
jgi:CRP-like cAMP-binding protein